MYVEADIKAVADWLSLGGPDPEGGGDGLPGIPGSGCEGGSSGPGMDQSAVISAGQLLKKLGGCSQLLRPSLSDPSSTEEQAAPSQCGIIALHACGSLTDAALEIAVHLRCSVAVMVRSSGGGHLAFVKLKSN